MYSDQASSPYTLWGTHIQTWFSLLTRVQRDALTPYSFDLQFCEQVFVSTATNEASR